MTEPVTGAILDLVVGPVAHGGHCVARAADGRVVFVRHALPGETVRAEVTEERGGYLRADAVQIVVASPDRVVAPCRFAGPDRCGGCDFQHASGSAQRALKTAVVVEQLTRLGRLSPPEIEALSVRVEPLPAAGDELLGWRSRLRYTVDATGRAGLLKHRSHEVVAVDRCLIAVPAVQALRITTETWPDDDAIEAVVSGGGDISVSAIRDGRVRRVAGGGTVTEVALGRRWALDAAAFWQVHPAAAATFVAVAMKFLDPRPGECAWDLYGGAGPFSAALAEAVGPGGAVTLVESDGRALHAATRSLADLPQVTIVASAVERMNMRRRDRPDVVVLDPPRSGAGARVVRALVAVAPRAIVYVACDPAAFARDVATFRDAGWRLAEMRAFDAFPMTHHMECVGLLVPVRA